MQVLPQPNNLGPTLLLILGLLTLPLLARQQRRLWRALRTRFAG